MRNLPGAERILFGLDALPRGMALDDPRLPCVALDAAALRLNSFPVPAAVLAGAQPGHEARVAAMTGWLSALAGDWARGRRRKVTDYMAFVAAEIERGRDALAARCAGYDGLFVPEDWFWSALRPLPRAWVVGDGTPRFVEMAFWDGRAVLEAGVGDFWREEALPKSPFRRQRVISIT